MLLETIDSHWLDRRLDAPERKEQVVMLNLTRCHPRPAARAIVRLAPMLTRHSARVGEELPMVSSSTGLRDRNDLTMECEPA